MYVPLFIISLGLVYVLINLVLVLLRNHRAHSFFALKEPKLPVLPNPSIVHGHMYNVTWQRKNWKLLEKYHNELGPTYGLYVCDKPWVCTKDIDLLKLIYVDQPHKHINRPFYGLPFKEFNHSIFQVNDDKWRRVRRAIAPALTNHKVRSDEVSADIMSVVAQLEDGIEFRMQQQESPQANKLNGCIKMDENGNVAAATEAQERSMILHADDMFQRFTLAVIFLITYKRDGKINFRAEHDSWVDQMEVSARQIDNPLLAASVMFPFMRPIIESLVGFHSTGRMCARIVRYIVRATDINRVAREQYERAGRKMSVQTGQPPRPFSELARMDTFKRRLVDTIIDAFIDKKIRYDEFVGSTLFLLLAGFQTTADTITCLVWQLAREPEIQEKLRAAIKRDGIEADYLSWCVQETVRYHPAVPLGTGRVLGEDVHMKGLTIPKGTYVQPTTRAIHHDPDIWPEPERFWPERWRDTSQNHPAAFMGFGLGPRNCVGGKLAVHEIKLVMRLLLTNYRIEKCSETPDQYEFTAPGLVYTNMDVPIKVRLVALAQPPTQATSTI